MNICLIGLMGAGKTTLGACLAAQLHLDFVDVDAFIEQSANKSIASIFQDEGESAFRQRETQALQILTARENVLLATGGGAPMLPENRAMLQQRTFIFYLHLSVHNLWKRLQGDSSRPLLQVKNPQDALSELYQKRHAVYLSTAHCVAHLDDLSLLECQNLIVTAYENLYSPIAH